MAKQEQVDPAVSRSHARYALTRQQRDPVVSIIFFDAVMNLVLDLSITILSHDLEDFSKFPRDFVDDFPPFLNVLFGRFG